MLLYQIVPFVPEGTALICFGDKTWITHANPQLYTPRICILFPIDVFFGARICGHSPIPDGPKNRTWFPTCHRFYLHNPYSPAIKDVKVESPINGHLNGQFPKSDDTTNGGGRVRRKLAGPLGWRRDQEEKKTSKEKEVRGLVYLDPQFTHRNRNKMQLLFHIPKLVAFRFFFGYFEGPCRWHGSRFGADTPIFVGGISGAAGHNISQPSGAL